VQNLNLKTPKRTPLILILLILTLIALNEIIANTRATPSDSLKIHINRSAQIETDGALIINDTIELSADADTSLNPITHFMIGLPTNYGHNLFSIFAYDNIGKLNVTTNVPLHSFYGVDLKFRDAVDLPKTGPYTFTVVYVLSGLVRLEGAEFNMSLSLFPILEKEIDLCNLTVVLPPRTVYTNSSLHFDNTTITTTRYSYQILNRTEINLRPFTNQTSWITFKHSGQPKEFSIIELNQLLREITLNPFGDLLVSDHYQLTNRGESLSEISFNIPRNATEISAQDVYGSLGQPRIETETDTFKPVFVSLREALKRDETTKLTLNYRLPFNTYVKQHSFEDYALTLDFLNFTRNTARKVIVKVNLPEGAEPQASPKSTKDIPKGETVFTNVTRFDNLNFDLGYRYSIFWTSFRPVTWVGVSAIIFSSVLFLRSGAKPAIVVAPVHLETLRRFVDEYGEKTRITLELESMERQVKSGKLSKRRYRLRRISLDNRLSKLQKELGDLRSKIESAGGRYANSMRQLEVAEAELETLRGDIERLEARYRRKELSTEAYRRLLDEYDRRRERTENTISGVVLRLREELH